MLLNILLFLAVAARISGIVAVAMSAFRGDTVKLFNITSFILNDSVVSLYVEASKFTLIAMWSKENIETVTEKFSLDEYGNVRIHNVTLSDERKYKVVHRKNRTSHDLWEAQLTVLVAPTNSCRPHVTRDCNTLIAYLQDDSDCGKPEAVPYWLEYPDITNKSRTKAILTPGRLAGTYNACIETPALSCARNYKPSDFCSSDTVHENTDTLHGCYQKPSTDSTLIVALAVALGIVGLFAIVVIILFLCRKRWGRLCRKEESHPITDDYKMVELLRSPQMSAVSHQSVRSEISRDTTSTSLIQIEVLN